MALIALGLSLVAGCGMETPSATEAPGLVQQDESVNPTPYPTGIEIPKIGVKGPLGRTDVDKDNVLIVSDLSDPKRIDWYERGGIPGDVGFPAVIISHVNGHGNPGGFADLHKLVRGDTVVVERGDGTRLGFIVDTVNKYNKAKFPTAEVYKPSPTVPKLVLITCGGKFVGPPTGYEDNIVVTAALDTPAAG